MVKNVIMIWYLVFQGCSVSQKIVTCVSDSENSGLKEDEFSSSHATKSPTWFPVLFSFIVIFAIADADS